jgi:hypothetical protein
VFVVAEYHEGTQARPDGLQQLDDHVDVVDLLANVASDAQQVGREALEHGPLSPKQTPIAAAHVQIADVHDRQRWPGLRQAQSMPLEDRSVGFAQDGIADTQAKDENQRQERYE